METNTVLIIVIILVLLYKCGCGRRAEQFHIRGTPGNIRVEAKKDYPFVPQVMIPQMTW